jgi:hypothetical protein
MTKNATSKPGRIRIENVNHPGSSTTVDAGMYTAMREALLEVLPAAAPGLTEGQMRLAVLPKLPEALFPGGERAGWWAKAVQLDLEAKAIIARETSRPLRWHRAAEDAEGTGAPTPDSPARTRAEALNAEVRRREALGRR